MTQMRHPLDQPAPDARRPGWQPHSRRTLAVDNVIAGLLSVALAATALLPAWYTATPAVVLGVALFAHILSTPRPE